jgi:hypothetical protein
MRIWYLVNPRSVGWEKNGIQDKHSEFATLQFLIKILEFFSVKFHNFLSSKPWIQIRSWIRICIDLKC